jgi:lipopolysaccharide/colanic/teichoic acid biosynthesis glycosyltransferase
MAKRVFDLLLAGIGLVIVGPVMLLIAAAVKLSSTGPVFYRGARVGRNGVPFRIFKFRTMVANADRIGGSSTCSNDVRVTGVGRFLRSFKLDELPQLINVVSGDMSLVGPRPEVQEYVDLYTEEEKAILQLRPGITDWASIWNSDEGAILASAEDPDRAYMELIRPTKLKLQLRYRYDHSVTTDLKILGCTFWKLIRSDWAPTEIAAIGRPGQPLVAVRATQRPAA